MVSVVVVVVVSRIGQVDIYIFSMGAKVNWYERMFIPKDTIYITNMWHMNVYKPRP